MSISNNCTFVGRNTRAPELRFLPNQGKAVCNVSVAVADDFDPKNSDKTFFVDAVSFGKTAEYIVNYSDKGKLIMLSGKMATDKWEKDGVKHSKNKLIIESVKILEWKDNNNSTQNGNQQSYQQNTPHTNNQNQGNQQKNQQQNSQNDLTGFQAIDSDDDIPHSSTS